jgi:hypothetical protein
MAAGQRARTSERAATTATAFARAGAEACVRSLAPGSCKPRRDAQRLSATSASVGRSLEYHATQQNAHRERRTDECLGCKQWRWRRIGGRERAYETPRHVVCLGPERPPKERTAAGGVRYSSESPLATTVGAAAAAAAAGGVSSRISSREHKAACSRDVEQRARRAASAPRAAADAPLSPRGSNSYRSVGANTCTADEAVVGGGCSASAVRAALVGRTRWLSKAQPARRRLECDQRGCEGLLQRCVGRWAGGRLRGGRHSRCGRHRLGAAQRLVEST